MNTLHILLMLSWALIVVSIVMSIRFIRFQNGQYTERVQDLIQVERESSARIFDEMADAAENDCEPSTWIAYLRGKAADIRSGAQSAAGG